MPSPTIPVFGGTGFIGQSLADHLARGGYSPILIARNDPGNLRHPFVAWDGSTVGAWTEVLNGAAAVVNLAGKSVDCVKTPDNCDVILRSRVDSTRAIGAALKITVSPPPVWVQMSTAHIYGDPPTKRVTEGDAFGYGLAPTVGQAWEAAFAAAKPEGMRGVVLRTSFVVGKDGGALASLKGIVRMGLGGTVGHGRQGFSWIHEYDMNEIIRTAITNDDMTGAYIATAPNPVSNADFMRTLRRAVGVPFGLPAPAFMVRLYPKLTCPVPPSPYLAAPLKRAHEIRTTHPPPNLRRTI